MSAELIHAAALVLNDGNATGEARGEADRYLTGLVSRQAAIPSIAFAALQVLTQSPAPQARFAALQILHSFATHYSTNTAFQNSNDSNGNLQ